MIVLKQICSFALLLISAAFFQAANASVRIDGTRFVYKPSDSGIGVLVLNQAERPVLMKAWIDEGDVSAKAELLKTPFLISPPLVRIEGKKSYTYRVTSIDAQASLPKDRESVFWMNFLEVPPKKPSIRDTGKGEASTIQLAFQYRIKLFYRPEKLTGDPREAAEKLRWVAEKSADGKRLIKAINDSAYHVSLTKLSVGDGSQSEELKPQMVAPRSDVAFELSRNAEAPKIDVSYQWIDDWGGLHDRKVSIGD